MNTLPCITICQPYASLIVGWDGMVKEDLKRIENRTWPPDRNYRGPLLIHAGASRKWLKGYTGVLPPDDAMPFKAIVGRVDLVECLPIEEVRKLSAMYSPRFGWARHHVHAEGPMCWILERPRRFLTPIPYSGKQKIFRVPSEVVDGVEEVPALNHLCEHLDPNRFLRQGTKAVCPGCEKWLGNYQSN